MRAVDDGFVHNWEGKSVFGFELLNLLVGAWFLLSEFITRETNYLQSLTFVGLIDFLQLNEVLISQTSVRSNIDNEGCLLSCDFSHTDLIHIDIFTGEVKEVLRTDGLQQHQLSLGYNWRLDQTIIIKL